MHKPSEDPELKLRFNHGGRFVTFLVKLYVEACVYEMEDTVVLEQNVFNITLLSFDDNKVLKIVNWIC